MTMRHPPQCWVGAAAVGAMLLMAAATPNAPAQSAAAMPNAPAQSAAATAGRSTGTAPAKQCPPLVRPEPLSLDAAREAFRDGERRHLLRLREAADPGAMLREGRKLVEEDEDVCLATLDEFGERLFEHEFTGAEGLKAPFRRVHEGLVGGPETLSCTSCHWVGGPAGAGAETDNAFLAGDGETPASGDARNPQALVGLGVVEALAREMSLDLQRQRDAFVRAAAGGGGARETRLVTKGVDFGVLRVTASGDVDASGIDGVDADLVVKPFGWKGTRPDVESFAAEAMQLHFGITGELGPSALRALATHLSLLEMPIIEPLVQDRPLAPAATALLAPTTTSFIDDFVRGREQFRAIGCAECHRPMLVLDDPSIVLGRDAKGSVTADLSRDMRKPGLRYDAAAGGYPVWLFSDLKRHDMGAANVARHEQRGVARGEYLTPRLWGVADSAPYLHDGRAPSFDYAIAGHDGEGAKARDAYAALPREQQSGLRVYLMSMRRASRVIVP